MRTVLHCTSGERGDWDHAIRSARLLHDHDELSHEDVCLLPHRWGVRMVLPDSPVADDVAAILEAGVTVVAGASCFAALDLPQRTVPGVEIVPSGVAEAVRRQANDYTYVKIP